MIQVFLGCEKSRRHPWVTTEWYIHKYHSMNKWCNQAFAKYFFSCSIYLNARGLKQTQNCSVSCGRPALHSSSPKILRPLLDFVPSSTIKLKERFVKTSVCGAEYTTAEQNIKLMFHFPVFFSFFLLSEKSENIITTSSESKFWFLFPF